MARSFAWIGAPSAAGAHSPGVEKAPAALRRAGLAERLAVRAAVGDLGDLAVVPFALDRRHPREQNVERVARVARDVARRTGEALDAGALPLIVGGDCTILLGALAGFIEAGNDVGLVYLDAHPDLNTPESVVQGALDWMGMAHALALPGAVGELTRVGPRTPLVSWADVVFFGCVHSELTAWERGQLAAHADRVVAAAAVQGRAAPAAREARGLLEARGAPFLVHFDVDVLDYVDTPIADNAYQRNQGLTLDEAMAALAVLAASALFGGLVLTEVNPDHLPDDDVLPIFASRLALALTARSGSSLTPASPSA